MTADPIVRICQACDDLVDDLDNLMVRITRADSVLALYRTYPHGPESGLYTVLDLANGFVRMLPPTSRDVCVRFARVYKAKHPETTLDATFSGEPKWAPDRAPAVCDTSDGRTSALLTSPVPQPAPRGEVASPEQYSVRVPSNVVPIR